MPMIDLTGKTAVVTGGSSGIGLATVELLLEAGAAVALCGRNAERLAQAEQGLRRRFPNARLFAATCEANGGCPPRRELAPVESTAFSILSPPAMTSKSWVSANTGRSAASSRSKAATCRRRGRAAERSAPDAAARGGWWSNHHG